MLNTTDYRLQQDEYDLHIRRSIFYTFLVKVHNMNEQLGLCFFTCLVSENAERNLMTCDTEVLNVVQGM
jgi:hypothetical protein